LREGKQHKKDVPDIRVGKTGGDMGSEKEEVALRTAREDVE